MEFFQDKHRNSEIAQSHISTENEDSELI